MVLLVERGGKGSRLMWAAAWLDTGGKERQWAVESSCGYTGTARGQLCPTPALQSQKVPGSPPLFQGQPWVRVCTEGWKAQMRGQGMTHAVSLPAADLAPLVRSGKHPVPEQQTAAQAGVSHGGGVADLRPGNPGGPPGPLLAAQGARPPWPEDEGCGVS